MPRRETNALGSLSTLGKEERKRSDTQVVSRKYSLNPRKAQGKRASCMKRRLAVGALGLAMGLLMVWGSFCCFNLVNDSIVKGTCGQLPDGFLVTLEMYAFSVSRWIVWFVSDLALT